MHARSGPHSPVELGVFEPGTSSTFFYLKKGFLDHAAKARIRSACLGSTKIRAYMNTTPQSPGRLLARPVIQITGHSVSGVALAARTPRRQRVPLDPARCLLNPGAQDWIQRARAPNPLIFIPPEGREYFEALFDVEVVRGF